MNTREILLFSSHTPTVWAAHGVYMDFADGIFRLKTETR